MIHIENCQIFRYNLPFIRPLALKNTTLTNRDGFLLKISAAVDGVSVCGVGEAAPLPGFSRETAEQALLQLQALPGRLQQPLPLDFEEMITAVDMAELAPSVRFALETALITIAARWQHRSISEILGGKPTDSVALNGLLAGSQAEMLAKLPDLLKTGYRTLKIKVGQTDVDSDIKRVRAIAERLPQDVNLRLDANRSWDEADAVHFVQNLQTDKIEYIEEPLSNPCNLADFATMCPFPIALDESLTELKPNEAPNGSHIAAIVLKPTLLGGIQRTMALARQAQRNDVKAVLSSSFESAWGIWILGHLAGAVDPDCAAGLETFSWFSRQLVRPAVTVRQGRLMIPLQLIPETQLNWQEI